MLSFSQYEIKSSESTRFHGSILMRFKSLEPPQFTLHASQFAFKSVEIEDLAAGWNCGDFYANFFCSISMLSFGQYDMKSSKATPFRGSILMRCRSLGSPQFFLHASQFAFKSVAKWRFWERLKSNSKFYYNFSSGKNCHCAGLNVYG